MGEDPIHSRYRQLRVPEFKCTIPAPLLARLAEQERYIVETLSRMEQQNAWIMAATLEANLSIIELDGRQSKVEVWKDRLTSKWALVTGALVLLAPIVIKVVFDHYFGKKP